MPLQVRLRHALGERLMDLPDRTAERPLVVGRSREADVKIPSVTVAAEQCALFVHDGQWVLQDTSGGSTLVNGAPAAGPTAMRIGDIISLGADASPATIEVDPAGAAQGRTGEPIAIAAPPPPLARSGPPTPQPFRGGYGAPVPQHYQAAPPLQMPPAPPPVSYADGSYGSDESPNDGGMMDWEQSAPSQANSFTSSARMSRRRKKTSDAPLILGILVGILIVGGSIWYAYLKMHPEAAPAVVQQHKPSDNTPQLPNMFTGDGGAAPSAGGSSTGNSAPAKTKPKPKPKKPASDDAASGDSTDNANSSDSATRAPQNTSDPTTASPSSVPDKSASSSDDRNWKEVVAAHYLPNQGQAILKFDDYRGNHQGDAEHLKTLDEYIEAAADRLWWQRIIQLTKQKNALAKQITQKEKDIRLEPTASFKKTLTDEKKLLEVDLGRVQERLGDDMGYTSTQVPDPDDADEMQKLRDARDATRYAAWKRHTLRYIRTHHGMTEWEGE